MNNCSSKNHFFFFKLAHSWNKWCRVIRGCIPTQTRKTQENLINFCIVFQNDKQYIGRTSKYRGYSAEQRLSTFWMLSSTVGTEGWISHRFMEVPHLDEYATIAGELLFFFQSNFSCLYVLLIEVLQSQNFNTFYTISTSLQFISNSII